MKGKTFVTILGLLLFQVLAALYMGIMTGNYLAEIIVALIFIIATISFLAQATRKNRAAFAAVLAFAFGFLHVVYLSFQVVTLWLVVILCLDAAGFILALDQLAQRGRPLPRPDRPVHARKPLIEKELPYQPPVKVTVYDRPIQKTSGKTTKKAVKKTAKKRQMPKKKIARKQAKKS